MGRRQSTSVFQRQWENVMTFKQRNFPDKFASRDVHSHFSMESGLPRTWTWAECLNQGLEGSTRRLEEMRKQRRKVIVASPNELTAKAIPRPRRVSAPWEPEPPGTQSSPWTCGLGRACTLAAWLYSLNLYFCILNREPTISVCKARAKNT